MKRVLDPGLTALLVGIAALRTWTLGYGYISVESLIAIVFALALSALLSATPPTWALFRTAVISALFMSIVVSSFVDSIRTAAALFVVGVLAALLLHKRLQPAFFVIFTLVFLLLKHFHDGTRSVDTDMGALPASSAGETQILVHVVMDELGSFDSIPPAHRNQADIDEIRDAYVKRGFRLYDAIASGSPETIESLGEIVRLRSGAGLDNVQKVDDKTTFRIRQNSLHQLYSSLGWHVSIAQSAYLDFCRNSAFACRTYQLGRKAYLLEQARIPLSERVAFFTSRELPAVFMGKLVAFSSVPWTLPLVTLNELGSFVERHRSVGGKRYIFGHFLFPHFPWILNKDCRPNPTAQWRIPYAARASDSAAVHAAVFNAYWQQTYCAHQRLIAMIDAFDEAHPGRVQFLLHGDHGPRILGRTLGDATGTGAKEEMRRNILEPFIAARMTSQLAPGETTHHSLQTLVQWLLVHGASAPRHTPGSPAQSHTLHKLVHPAGVR